MRLPKSLLLVTTALLTFTLCNPVYATTTKTTHKSHKTTTTKVATKPKKAKKVKTTKAKAVEAAIPTGVSIQQGIDQILSRFPNLTPGVIVVSADSGNVVYAHNADHNYMPASTMKLFTGAAALTYLGPNYIFQTQILTDNPNIQNGVLLGNLYVKFSGDPELTVQDVAALVNILANSGIQQIRGNLIIDDTVMDRVNLAPGWMLDEQLDCYAAPTAGVILNRNCFSINVVPAKQYGEHAQIQTSPPLEKISIINNIVTSKTPCSFSLKPAGSNTYEFNGCVTPKRAPFGAGVSLNDPRAAGTNLVLGLLSQHGIQVTGQLLYKKTPNNLKVLAEHDSRPLSALLTRMLKKSDNLIADTLYKKLGNAVFNVPGTWQNGAQAMREVLGPKSNIDFNSINIVDGAGLSRYAEISPQQFANLLMYAYRMPYKDVFFQALPISAVDGTLRYRMGGATQGKIHAKTGTIGSDFISGLAGYVQSRNNGTYIFAVLVNESSGSQGTFHMVEDRICQFLALRSGGNSTSAPAPAATPVTPAAATTQNKPVNN